MAKPMIFIVEDDLDIARLVQFHLEAADFSVRIFSDGNSVIAEGERLTPKLFILDVMIPGIHGLELSCAIREAPALARTPIMILTAKSNEFDRVQGLEMGGDDYISKPCNPQELVARIKALLRRYAPPACALLVQVGDLQIDPAAMTLTVRGRQEPTTSTEFRLLAHFVRNIGRVFTRDQILDSVWGEETYVTARSVDVYVRRVRGKIEKDPENPIYLKTVRGAGYRFDSVER